MKQLHEHLIAKTAGRALPENGFVVDATRITVLAPQIIRIENEKSRIFTDEPTQCIWFRNMPRVPFTKKIEGNTVLVKTDKAIFAVDAPTGRLSCVVLDGRRVRPGASHNLKGTARTLDGAFCAIPLKDGVISTDGVAVFDDSGSLVLNENGMVERRRRQEKDCYVFAFGRDYIGAVRALYALAGRAPLVPRFALGNWWSRYRAYTQEEYQNLMLRFRRRDIPLTVATVDMDWHWVKLEERFRGEKFKKTWMLSSGWTGYSWNTELFPDHKGFLNFLHGLGLKVTMNLHPADGFRWFEDCYPEMAKAMGKDALAKETVEFDIADPKFINAYLDIGHHPLEEEGVDFWWVDWQQGTKSRLQGLDPLWSLNHYHYLDSGRGNKRPLILSRYAGIGSHRYPLGFSGDTAMSWEVLGFEPYFTATASNCGYTWWSHDIGGHHFGEHDGELYARWVQFGVFSPILRLHSTSNDLFGKEPWNFSWEAEQVASEFLRLRHRLIPYIYTMNYRTHSEGRALCEPLYYTCPNEPEAYRCKNGYMFGSELLVCPVTTKLHRGTKTACTPVYLPEGRWTNIFTGKIYRGGKTVRVHSELNTLPVFARAGAVVPTSLDEGNGVRNPERLKLSVYRGNGRFVLYEDDGETNAYAGGECSRTEIRVSETGGSLCLTVKGAKAADYMPEKRQYRIEFADLVSAGKIELLCGGNEASYRLLDGDRVCLETEPLPIGSELEVRAIGVRALQNPPFEERILHILTKYDGNNTKKTVTYLGLKSKATREQALSAAKRVQNRALRLELLEALEDME